MNEQIQTNVKPAQKSSFAPSSPRLLQRKCACGGAAGISGKCEECSKKKRFGLQTKLKVNKPGDNYEQEADRIAGQVMSTPVNSTLSGAPPRVPRSSGQSNGQMDAAPASVYEALASPGRPLEPTLRQPMEQRFGHDFSMVRVHSGTAAEISARDLNANAYTVGHNIVFAAGRFAPGTHAGQRLIAHELTHVVQQSGADEIPVGLRNGNRSPSHSVQRVAEQAADGALVQRKDSPAAGGSPPKAPSGPRGKDDQEQSWANPSISLATEPVLVATIYFRTKEFSLDANDEAVLLQLAKAYAPWARRNLAQRGAEQGLRGRIVGYADPRPSVEPNNAKLSSERADIVERRLSGFLQSETRLIAGSFDFQKEAGGVALPEPEAGQGLEEVSLGWQRRAEIYIAGQAWAPEPPAMDAPPNAPVVADPQKHPDVLDRWMPLIEACHPEFARGSANMVLAALLSGRLLRESFTYTGTLPIGLPLPGPVGKSGPHGKQLPSPKVPLGSISLVEHGGVLPFTPRKPPWWDARTSGYSKPPLHRQALSPKAVKCDQLVRKTQMLIRDQREVNTYIDHIVGGQGAAYPKFMAELRKVMWEGHEPDVAKLREYAVPIEHLMFMWDALKDSAGEVLRLADAVEAM